MFHLIRTYCQSFWVSESLMHWYISIPNTTDHDFDNEIIKTIISNGMLIGMHVARAHTCWIYGGMGVGESGLPEQWPKWVIICNHSNSECSIAIKLSAVTRPWKPRSYLKSRHGKLKNPARCSKLVSADEHIPWTTV